MLDGLQSWLTTRQSWRADGVAGGLGALSATALPPVHAIPVLLLTLPILLVLIDSTSGPAVAARRGYWFGFGLNLVGLYWVTEAILVEAARFWWLVPFAVPLLAAALAFFIAAPVGICRLAPAGWPRALALASAWTLADLTRQFAFTGFPWNPWGSVWAIPGLVGDAMIQPAALVGVHGLTFATLLLAMLPAFGRRATALAGAALLAWAVYGASRLASPTPPRTGVSVVVVQGDIPEGEKWSLDRASRTFARYLQLTAAALGEAPGRPRVVVWPETASPFLMDADPVARAELAKVVGADTTALIGSVRFGEDRRPRNSLMALRGDGPPLGIYDKWHLVPFGEYQPDWIPLLIPIVPGGGFVPGPGPRTLDLPGLPSVGPLICYEAIFPGEIIAAERPGWLVNITNDAWFGDSSGPRQHLAAARLRAVEEGLPLVRAANTGISAIFDAFGREIGRIGLNQAGTLVRTLPGALGPTPFARFGLKIPLAIGSAGLVLAFLVRRRAPAQIRPWPDIPAARP